MMLLLSTCRALEHVNKYIVINVQQTTKKRKSSLLTVLNSFLKKAARDSRICVRAVEAEKVAWCAVVAVM